MSFKKYGNYRETTYKEERNLQYETWKGCVVESLSFPSAGVKDIGKKIVAKLAKNEGIAKLYSGWIKVNREKLSLYFEKKVPDIPLEDNPEFRSIQNVIVKSTALATRIIQAEGIENFNIATEI